MEIEEFEFLLSSSSDSSDEEEMEFLQDLCRCHYRQRVPRVVNFSEDVIERYNDEDFRKAFRLSRNTFNYLLHVLNPHLQSFGDLGNLPIPPRKQLLIAIWVLATPDSYRSVSCKFGVGQSTAWRCVYRVVKVLYEYRNYYIRWPSNVEIENTARALLENYGYPHIIGAIDCSEIRISKPGRNGNSYINRKRYPSIKLQIVCNQNMRILHAFSGYPGSVHDMRVFRHSGMQQQCTEEFFPGEHHILGDSAYTLQNNVMIPFRDNGFLSLEQTYFNNVHSTIRSCVERCFALLKGKWRILLDGCPMVRFDLIPYYIIACCILHNIGLMRDEELVLPVIAPEVQIFNTYEPLFPSREQQEQGRQKRENICDILNNV